MAGKNVGSSQYGVSQQQFTPEEHARLHENLLKQQKRQELARKLRPDDPPRWAKWCIECPHCPSPQICSCHDSEEDQDDIEAPTKANLVYQGGSRRDVTRFCEAWRQRDEQGQTQSTELTGGSAITPTSQAQAQPNSPTPERRLLKEKAAKRTPNARATK